MLYSFSVVCVYYTCDAWRFYELLVARVVVVNSLNSPIYRLYPRQAYHKTGAGNLSRPNLIDIPFNISRPNLSNEIIH
jgi:hypothetical protein